MEPNYPAIVARNVQTCACSVRAKLSFFGRSTNGPIAGMRCVEITEPKITTWDNNYLCVPPSSPYHFTWSHDGRLSSRDYDCMKWEEKYSYYWRDNYLCAPEWHARDKRSDDTVKLHDDDDDDDDDDDFRRHKKHPTKKPYTRPTTKSRYTERHYTTRRHYTTKRPYTWPTRPTTRPHPSGT